MAVAAYAYDSKAGRSDRPTEIAGDLERAGVPLDVDTVRKWLREAAELLPPKGAANLSFAALLTLLSPG